MSDTEQLYGREGNEAAQGYVPMPAPTTNEPDSELEHAEALTKWVDDRDKEARPIIERQYFDEADKPQRPNKTVELDRAARDLAENREAEDAIAEFERTQQLAAEIDAARGLQSQPEAQQTEPAQSEAPQQQQRQSAPTDNGVDPEVARALQNPKVLSAIQQQRAADIASVETAINSATEWANQSAGIALAALFARPELSGIPPQQLPGALAALAKTNPVAHMEIQHQVNNVRTLQQQAAQAQQQQQQRSATAFQEWGKANDDAFEKSVAGEAPEAVSSVRAYARQMLNEAGLSDHEILQHWNNNALFRSVQGQQILADAARYRMNKAAVANKIARPVPHVNRPGSSVDRPDAADRDQFALENRYRGPLSAKQAAELVISRRARAR